MHSAASRIVSEALPARNALVLKCLLPPEKNRRRMESVEEHVTLLLISKECKELMWKYLQLPQRICCQFPFPYRFAEGKHLRRWSPRRTEHLVLFARGRCLLASPPPSWSMVWLNIPSFIWKLRHFDSSPVWIRGTHGPTTCSLLGSKQSAYD